MARKGRGERASISTIFAEVANLLAAATDGADAELVAAGWLHDTIEDTETTREELAQKFSDARRCAGCRMHRRHELAARRSAGACRSATTVDMKSPSARLIKIADKISNIGARILPDRSAERVDLDYTWAEQVVAGCRGASWPTTLLTKPGQGCPSKSNVPSMPTCSAHHRRQGAAGRHRSHHRGGEGFHHLWRGGEVRRRQGDPRRHGPVAGDQQAGRGRHRHHQRADRRSLGHRQSRRRDQGRHDQRYRQGRQSRHPARRHHRDRPRHRRHRGRRQDPHRRRLRQPHPFHLPAADRACADVAASPRCSAAAPAPRTAPSRPPARRAPGTWDG